jgi:hypothetical protein
LVEIVFGGLRALHECEQSLDYCRFGHVRSHLCDCADALMAKPEERELSATKHKEGIRA